MTFKNVLISRIKQPVYEFCYELKKKHLFLKNSFVLTNDIVVAAITNRMGLIPRRQ